MPELKTLNEQDFDYARFADFLAEVYLLATKHGYAVSRDVKYGGGYLPQAAVTFTQSEETPEVRRLRLSAAEVRISVAGFQYGQTKP